MEHSQGVLLIQKQKSATSGEWEQFAKIGISKSLPPEDIVPGLPDEILTLCAIHSPMPEVLKSQILKRFSHLRASQNRLLLENHLAEKNIASDCNNNVQIISLLNKDRGHLWPGIEKSVGYCYSQPQSVLDYSKCNFSIFNEWGNDFLIKLLFDLKN